MAKAKCSAVYKGNRCTNDVHCKGLCNNHYRSFVKYDDTYAVEKRKEENSSVRAKILSKIKKSGNCSMTQLTMSMRGSFKSPEIKAELQAMIGEKKIEKIRGTYSMTVPRSLMSLAWTTAGMA